MSQRLDSEEYNRRIKELHNGSIILLSKYIKSNIKVIAMCVKCGYKFNILPYNLIVKQKPCDICSGRVEKINKKLQFKNEGHKYKLYEIDEIWENKNPGIYFIFNKDKVLCNVGKTKTLRNRLLQHLSENGTYTYANYILVKNEDERSEIERGLINILKPTDNYWDVYTYNFSSIPNNKYRYDNLKLYENKLANEIFEERSGIYFIFDQNNNKLLYIDKAENIKEEIDEYCKNDTNYYANYIVMADNAEIENAKHMLITLFKPVNN